MRGFVFQAALLWLVSALSKNRDLTVELDESDHNFTSERLDQRLYTHGESKEDAFAEQNERRLFFPGLFCVWCQNSIFGSGIASSEDMDNGNPGGWPEPSPVNIPCQPEPGTTCQPSAAPTTASPTAEELEWVKNTEGTLQGRIADGFGTWNYVFGVSPRLDANRLVFGSWQGQAYVYRYDASTKAYSILEDKLRNSDPFLCMEGPNNVWDGDLFGSPVALNGDRIVVGATRQFNEGRNRTGAVYVFDLSGSQWSQTTKISPPQGLDGDLFGFAIAVSGSTVAIGQCSVVSKVWIFEEDAVSGEWILFQVLDGPVDSGFGCFVEMNEQSLVVSAPQQKFVVETRNADSELGNWTIARGAVHIFERDSAGKWNATDVLSPEVPQTLAFGGSLALFGHTLAVGAPLQGGDFDQFSGNGGFFVYERQPVDKTWKLQANKWFSNVGDAQFGATIAMHGNRILLGSKDERANIYVFDNDELRFEERISGGPGISSFGSHVALHSDRLAITSERDYDLTLPGLATKGSRSRHGFLYQYNSQRPNPVQPSDCPTIFPSLPTTNSPAASTKCPHKGWCSTSSLPKLTKFSKGFIPEMSDDGFAEFHLQFDFQWLGVQTIPKGSTLLAYSNGQIGFPPIQSSKGTNVVKPIGSYASPRIAMAQTDLNPENGGVVKIDNTTEDALTVTYWEIPFYPDEGRVQIQTVLSPNGQVTICFGEGDNSDNEFVTGVEDACLGLSFPATNDDYGFNDVGVSTEGVWPYGYCYCFDPCTQSVRSNIVAVSTPSPSSPSPTAGPETPSPAKSSAGGSSTAPAPVAKGPAGFTVTASPTTMYPTFQPVAGDTGAPIALVKNQKRKKKRAKKVKPASTKAPKSSSTTNSKRNLSVRGI